MQSCLQTVPLTKVVWVWEALLITHELHKTRRWNYERQRPSVHCKLTGPAQLQQQGTAWGKTEDVKERPQERCSFTTAAAQREMKPYQHERCASALVGSHGSACNRMLWLYSLLHRTTSTCSSGTSSSAGSQAAR